MIAYQVGFDLAEGATQEYLAGVEKGVVGEEGEKEVSPCVETRVGVANDINVEADLCLPSSRSFFFRTRTSSSPTSGRSSQERRPSDSTLTSFSSTTMPIFSSSRTPRFVFTPSLLRSARVLPSRNSLLLPLLLPPLQDALEARSSMYHSAVTFANAFMNAGTTSDQFLRQNLDWLGRASNWSKFSATAALGVIHKGNLSRGMTLLGPYLPGAAATSSPYSEGGSLYALGLINAGRGKEVLEFLKGQLGSHPGEEVVQHGAALGLGVAGMASGNEGSFDLFSLSFLSLARLER